MKESNLLTKIIEDVEKSCFKCTNFKIHPFKKSKKGIIIKFRVTKERARCCYNKLNANASIIKTINYCDKDNSIELSGGLKSHERYRRIALYCDSYDSDS